MNWLVSAFCVISVCSHVAAAAAQSQSQPVMNAGDRVRVAEGFVVEQVFEVPREKMGSWVSLAADGQGRLIASDQGGLGLYRITPGSASTQTQVEKLPVDLTSVQGMAVVGDVLYAVVNGQGSGLYRVTASSGDGRFDTAELLVPLKGGGEHGPHAVRLAPSGDSLYVVCGNHTQLPEGIERYRVPNAWGEDHLLPQRTDPNGHAAGIRAPAGYVFKCDFDGQHIELFSIGYRNAYDMAFNADGELFAYDADMEWDMGLPWYRPTRLCHVTSGSEFGWRTGSGKWPEFYEDSLPSVVDIGPGSPTGVEFGYGSRFPAKYQRALYLLDWTFGTMYAVTLTPHGSTYTGTVEEFLSGKPLPLTDAVVASDGALYFATGGRGVQSHLYRVRYVGDEPTDLVDGRSPPSRARDVLKNIESQHGKSDPSSPLTACLGTKDRFLRYASRVVYESQDVEFRRGELRELFARAKGPMSVAQLAMVFARRGDASELPLVVDKLASLELKDAEPDVQSAAMRAMALTAIRLGPLSEEQRRAWLPSLRSLQDQFGDFQSPISSQWFELMVYLDAPEAIELGVAVMDAARPAAPPKWGHLVARSDQYGGTVARMLAEMPPIDAVQVAFILRNAKVGWTEDLARRYFAFFPAAADRGGGNSYRKHLLHIRTDAIGNLSPDLQVALGDAINAPLDKKPIEVKPPAGPGREWNKSAAMEVIASLKGSDFADGRNLFHATGCIKCHRFAGEGEAIGPDLSSVSNKFSKSDLLDSLLEPDKAISDQYGSHQVITMDGRVLTGRVVEIGDEIRIYTAEYEKPPVVLGADDIDEMTPSKVSQMPAKLCDELNEQEFRNLVAYLLAGGNERAPFYRD